MSQNQVVRGTATRVVTGHATNGARLTQCVYHSTVVASRIGNEVVLNSGGYRTNTTKLRMNQFSNQFCQGRFTVYQEKGEWFVALLNGAQTSKIPFHDGMTITL